LQSGLLAVRLSRRGKNEERAQQGARANGPKRPWLILNVRQRKIYDHDTPRTPANRRE
jgi:hypothetical protein